MKRAAILALALGACTAAPPPPPPAAPPPPEPSPEPQPPVLDLVYDRGGVDLTASDAAGKTLWSVPLRLPLDTRALRDGGAYVVTDYNPGSVKRIDAAGAVAWSSPLPKSSASARLLDAGEHVLVVDPHREGGKISIHRAADGAVVRELSGTAARLDARGGIVVAEAAGVAKIGANGERFWSVPVGLFPPSDSSRLRPPERHLAIAGDAVLAGASDGSLLGLDGEGRPRFQLGLRGRVTGIEDRPAGDFVVTTTAGVIAAIDRDGRVRWETWLGPDAVSPPRVLPDGGVLVSTAEGAVHAISPDGAPRWHEPIEVDVGFAPRVLRGEVVPNPRSPEHRIKLDTPHAQAPRATPTGAWRVETTGLRALGVVANRPDEVWVLTGERVVWPDTKKPRLHRWDGKAFRDLGVPSVKLEREVFVAGGPRVTGAINPRGLARGPGGALVVIAARDHALNGANDSPGDIAEARAAVLLQRDGEGFRERRELFEALANVPQGWRAEYGEPRYAASKGGQEVLCVADQCLTFGGGKAPRVEAASWNGGPMAFVGETLWSNLDKTWTKRAPGRDAETILPRGARGPLPPVLAFWGANDGDLWMAHDSYSATMVSRLRGDRVDVTRSPAGRPMAVWGSGPDDVWIGGDRGAARFDGARWTRIAGVDGRVSLITGSGRGDVWIVSEGILFHVTPTGAGPDIDAPAPPAPPAVATASSALAIAGVDAAYRLERASLRYTSKVPLRGALGVAEGPGGVTWLHDGHRVIEVVGDGDGDKAREIESSRGGLLGCHRCLAPAGAGEGFLLEPGLRRVTGGRSRMEIPPMPTVTAIARAPSGELWAVSAGDDDGLPHALVLGAKGVRLLSGAPAAAYADVAARAGDDVWLAGGLARGEDDRRSWPEGEGILVRFDGRGFTRHRAPDGALLAVAAAGPGEAWAVGVVGSIVHAKAGELSTMHLPREGTRAAPLLRAVSVGTGGDVWIAGDDATLLRFDGRVAQRIDTKIAGPRATFTAVVAPGARAGWAVGPGGIYRIVPAR